MATNSLQRGVSQDPRRRDRARISPPRLLKLLTAQAGITFNGGRLRDIEVRKRAFYLHVMQRGSLVVGKACIDDMPDSEIMTRVVPLNSVRAIVGEISTNSRFAVRKRRNTSKNSTRWRLA